MALTEIPAVGTHVRFVQPVDRWPDFVADAGLTGTVAESGDPNVVHVRMDAPLAGAEEWDNCVQFFPGWGADYVAEILESMEVVS